MRRKLWNCSLRLVLALSLLGAAALTAPVAAVAETKGANLLVNSGFEMPPEETRPIPGWNLRASAPGIVMETTDIASCEGSSSMRVADDSTATAVVAYSDPVEVSAGDTLKLTFKATNTTGTVFVGIRTYRQVGDDVVNHALNNKYVTLTPSTAWTEFAVESTVPEGAAYARVLVYSQNGGKGATLVDDFHLSIADVSTVPYELTNLGPFIHNIDISRAVFYKEPSGRTLAYATLSGIPAKLLVIDVDAETVLKQIPVEDTVNGTYYKASI